MHSQNGEDGVLRAIFNKIGHVCFSEKWCVEFGAWDGKHLSNTFAFIEAGWSGVYIEGEADRFNDLLETTKQYPKITPINAFVDFRKGSSETLDALLETTSIPQDYELLSIDIDSFDLAVWGAYSGKPKVVVIEIESSIQPGILQWHDGEKQFGNSFSPTVNIAKSKGYTLVCHTRNLIFIRDDMADLLELDQADIQNPERLFITNWLIAPQASYSLSYFIARRFLPRKIKSLLRRIF